MSTRLKVAAIVQARMRSTRLPGKVLRPVSGRELIGHTVDRLRECTTVTDIAVVTSTEPEDDVLVAFAHGEGIAVFRGDEADVLGRYALAVDALKPNIILRVTGDCPLLSSEFIDSLVHQLTDQEADFLIAPANTPCIHEGVDVISARAFQVLMTNARDHPVAREHVTSYFKHHPEAIKIGSLHIDGALRFSGARVSVDTPADLRFLLALETRLGPLRQIRLEDVVSLLNREPWLMTINAHVHQKSASSGGGTVLIRADGGGALGYGHLKRCLSIAHALREREGFGVVFLTGFHPLSDGEQSAATISADDFPVLRADRADVEEEALSEALSRTKAKAAVFDVRTDLSRAALSMARAEGAHITVIDDASDRRLAANLAVYPPVPKLDVLGWEGFDGELLAGGDWALLSPAIVAASDLPLEKDANSLLVTMGGSDPYRLTLPIARACARLAAPEGYLVRVLVGPGFTDKDAIERELSDQEGIEPVVEPEKPELDLRKATMAVAAFGVTAHELAALGIPALYVCPTADHRRSAEAFAVLGAGAAVAGPGMIDADEVAKQALALMRNSARRERMAEAGPAAVDGRAADRLAARIAEAVRQSAQERRFGGAQTEKLRANRQWLRP